MDRVYEDVDFAGKNKFREYIVKVSELNSSFFVLIKRYRGTILVERQKFLFNNLKEITENVYKENALKSKEFERDYFPYFKLEEIQIKPWMHSCVYFCPHFLKAYRGKGKIANVNCTIRKKRGYFYL